MSIWLILAQAQAQAPQAPGGLDLRAIVPILVALAITAVVIVVVSTMFRGKERAEERLERFGKLGGGGETATQATGTERLQELLEKAAPTLAKPLTSKSVQEQSRLKIELANAGFRSENAPMIYLGIRAVCALVGLMAALPVLFTMTTWKDRLMYGFIAFGVFLYIPTVTLWWRTRKRKEQIFYGLPDALDLMVVCVEAGLGLDAAMRKVCEEMGRTYPIISEEFSICNFQLQMGRARRDVLHDLGVRTGVDDMKSLAAILIQADRFGASIAQALRVQSDSMRVRRKQEAEERAAKTAVQLIFPLVLFIFPAIFVVLVGPAGIKIYEAILKDH